MTDILGNFVHNQVIPTETERKRLLRTTEHTTHLPQPQLKGTAMQFEIKLLTSGAIIPLRATGGSAGYDVYLPKSELTEPLCIQPKELLPIYLGFAIHIESPTVAMGILPRSSTGKRGLHLANTLGVVDSDYQGEVILLAYNRNDIPIYFERDEAIAQLLFFPILLPELKVVKDFSMETTRGTGGFGSTTIPRNIQV